MHTAQQTPRSKAHPEAPASVQAGFHRHRRRRRLLITGMAITIALAVAALWLPDAILAPFMRGPAVTPTATPVASRPVAALYAIVETMEALPEPLAQRADEISRPELALGLVGEVRSTSPVGASESAPGSMPVGLAARNWTPERTQQQRLLDMLAILNDGMRHAGALADAMAQARQPVLTIDYAGVTAMYRDSYTRFLNELASAMDAELAVVIPTPVQRADGSWHVPGYDVPAIGAAADRLYVTMPLAPEAYAPGGTADAMLDWLAAQVAPGRTYAVLSARGTDGARLLDNQALVAPMGTVQIDPAPGASLTPGEVATFSLQPVEAVTSTGGTVGLRWEGGTHWLGTAAWWCQRAQRVAAHGLAGVVLRDATGGDTSPSTVEGIAACLAGESVPGTAAPRVHWTVTHPDGTLERHSSPTHAPRLAWAAPAQGGTYRIAASVLGQELGSHTVSVGAQPPPAPAAPPVVPAFRCSFVSDVTVPDGTAMQPGERFAKTWRVRNTGSQPWPEDTALTFQSGERMTTISAIPVGAVAPGQSIDITIPELRAPQQGGRYTGRWALVIGQRPIPGGALTVNLRIVVPPSGTPTPIPLPTLPTSTPIPLPTAIPTTLPIPIPTSIPLPTLPPTPIPLPTLLPPQGNFELGGHIRSTGHHAQMRHAGMNWFKVQIGYNGDASGILGQAHAMGFKVQLSALGGPEMVTRPGFEQTYAQGVARLAAQGADAIEIWNEPNIDREWQRGHIDPAAYTRLLCAAYHAIKAANPNTLVISGAPAPTGYFGGCGPNGCDDRPWLEGMAAAGAGQCMDVIGAHHNAGATPPSARTGHPADDGTHHHSWYFLPQTELYYGIFGGTRQIFYTELGYASQEGVAPFSDQFAWARGITNADQANWLAEVVRLSRQTGMVRTVIVWNIDFTARFGHDPQDGYAILRPGGGCPACDTLHQAMQ